MADDDFGAATFDDVDDGGFGDDAGFGDDGGFGDDAGFGDDGGGGWGDDDLIDPDDPTAAMAAAPTPPESKELDLSRYEFGELAFGRITERKAPKPVSEIRQISSSQIAKMLSDSVKGVGSMRGQRGSRSVSDMIQGIYQSGLFTLGGPDSAINRQVIPAIRYVFEACSGMAANDPKRVASLSTIARACEDCQQVQAREILRVYGDLTNQTQTFEIQVHYFLLRQKEGALNSFISQFHQDCDQDHTVVKPWQQRAHLVSAYLDMLGDMFGLDGVEAAKGDRFLAQVRAELDKGVWAGVNPQAIFLMLKKHLNLKQFLNYLLADINNQSDNADRLINRDVIFKWVTDHMSSDDAHLVFYDEERADEFAEQDPKAPVDKNKFQPFLSTKLLVRILVEMGFIQRK